MLELSSKACVRYSSDKIKENKENNREGTWKFNEQGGVVRVMQRRGVSGVTDTHSGLELEL